MKLNKIIIEGFKSFANRTEINLSEGFTTIVGPNGAGKSNITDAIKWVLGDQSPKNLRGKSMQDVIFSGSDAKKAMNFAEVTLVIDNSSRELPIEFDEVSLSRLVYRNGDAEYKINNSKARLKDIQELMIDTGVQASSFSMISQGKIESIFNSRPEDRRAIFEEAAGVLKYKRRKHEANLKIAHVESNLERIEDIVHELGEQLKPLKVQKKQAEQFLKLREELKEIEVALLVQQIETANNNKHEISKTLIELENEKLDLDFENKNSLLEIENLLSKNLDIDAQITEHQNKLLEFNTEIQNLETKALLDTGLNVDNKEFYLTRLNTLKSNLTQKENDLKLKNPKESDAQIKSNLENQQRHSSQLGNIENELNKLDKRLNSISHQVTRLNSRKEFIEQTKDNLANLHQGVRAIVENKNSLSGIIGTIYDLVEIENEHKLAIEAALGSSIQYVATKTTKDARNAINFLKKTRDGKATFIARDNLNYQLVENKNFTLAKHQKGYIGLAHELVKFEEIDRQLFEALLGNTVLVDNLENAQSIYEELPNKVKVITLDGEIISPRGFITGGKTKNQKNSLLSMDLELQKIPEKIHELNQELEEINAEKKELEISKESLMKILDDASSKLRNIENTKTINEQIVSNLKTEIIVIKKEISEIEKKFESTSEDDFKNHLKQEIISVKAKKEIHEQKLSKLRSDVQGDKLRESELRNKIATVDKRLELINRTSNKSELDFSKLELEISNALRRLSEEYQIIYSTSMKVENYFDDIEKELIKVSKIRNKIIQLGDVNIGAIEEYARINERYLFIDAQRQDTVNAKNNLLELISQMDKEMETRFIETFEQIEVEFNKTFQDLFDGGEAQLVLTDKNNILETGVDIIARPPGKKLSRITLLSGGEKSLTAISLLFAILKIKTIPLVVLDEAEAALDDHNVDRYSQYLKAFNGSTQFLVITHRKGTMENADYLYGVTMQDKGISKIVSVDLKNMEDNLNEIKE